MGKKRGRSAKKARQSQLLQGEGKEVVDAPHSFVIHRGKVGRYVTELVKDMRRVVAPYTAEDLKVKRKNKFKDFVSVAGPLHVTHMMVFTKTEKCVNFRLCRLPRGPTLTFQVKSYCLARDIISSISRHNMEPKQFSHHPLLVMNNFKGDDMQAKLMTNMLQNLFPPINVNKVKLNNIRRCVLFNYISETKQIEFRHYNIRVVPVGVGRAVKKLVQSKIPNLASLEDISEYVMNAGNNSESEGELDGPHNKVVLPQDVSGRGNMKSAQSAVRLTEIGPRMTLQLVKIEDGLCGGEVLYHDLIKKTAEEVEDSKAAREKKRLLKAQRRAAQEERVKAKEKTKLDQSKASRAAAAASGDAKGADGEGSDEAEALTAPLTNQEESEDDTEHYRKEVGVEPDRDLFPKSRAGFKRKLPSYRSSAPFAKRKKSFDGVERKPRTSSGSYQQKQRRTDRTTGDSKHFGSRRTSRSDTNDRQHDTKFKRNQKFSGTSKRGRRSSRNS